MAEELLCDVSDVLINNCALSPVDCARLAVTSTSLRKAFQPSQRSITCARLAAYDAADDSTSSGDARLFVDELADAGSPSALELTRCDAPFIEALALCLRIKPSYCPVFRLCLRCHGDDNADALRLLFFELCSTCELYTFRILNATLSPLACSELSSSLSYSLSHSLKCIHLHSCILDNACLEALAPALQFATSLHTLDLGWNKMSLHERSLLYLAECIAARPTSHDLQKLVLSGNDIGSSAHALALCFPRITVIHLDSCGIDDASSARLLSDSPLQSARLPVDLHMKHNFIGSRGSSVLADLLRTHEGMQSIDLTSNCVNSDDFMSGTNRVIIR